MNSLQLQKYNSEIQFQQGTGLHVLHAPFFTKDLSLFNVITNTLHKNSIAIHIVKTSHNAEQMHAHPSRNAL